MGSAVCSCSLSEDAAKDTGKVQLAAPYRAAHADPPIADQKMTKMDSKARVSKKGSMRSTKSEPAKVPAAEEDRACETRAGSKVSSKDENERPSMGRPSMGRSGSEASTRSVRSRNSRKNNNEPNLLVTSLLTDFQEALRSRFKSREQAFETLGGGDDGRIDEAELQSWLKSHGFVNQNLNKQLFRTLDGDKSGYITRTEFRSLFDVDKAMLDEFKVQLREAFKSRKEAFERLGGKGDGEIDREEFEEFVGEHMGIYDERKITGVFNAIDDNKNGIISHAEFKTLFQPEGEIAKIMEFKEDIRKQFKSRNAAFEKLGGADDGRIDRKEFQTFLEKHLGYANEELKDQLFNIIDDDNNGFITKEEFEVLFIHQTGKAVKLKETLKLHLQEKSKSRKEAFDLLGGEETGRVDRDQFLDFMKRGFANEDVQEVEEIFKWMDIDNDGFVTFDEFKKFF